MIRKMKQTSHGPKNLPKTSRVYPAMKHAPSILTSEQQCKQFFSRMFLKQEFMSIRLLAKSHRKDSTIAGLESHLEILIKHSLSSLKLKVASAEKIFRTKCWQKLCPQLRSSHHNCFTKIWATNFNETSPGRVPIIPPPNDELLVWELKRPLLEPLPSVPEQLYQVFKKHLLMQSSAKNDPPDEEDEKMLHQAKGFCIAQIASCLPIAQDSSDDTRTSITTWLQSFHAVSVVKLYDDLNDQLRARNGFVVETNPTLSIATGASTNTLFFGGSHQSRCALFYAAPYMCKNKVALDACLTALEAAQKHVLKFPSIASDSGTNKRYVQHMFTRVLNSLSRMHGS